MIAAILGGIIVLIVLIFPSSLEDARAKKNSEKIGEYLYIASGLIPIAFIVIVIIGLYTFVVTYLV